MAILLIFKTIMIMIN